MSGPKQARAKQLPGKVRQAFDQALEQLASGEHGTTITLRDIWIEIITQDPIKALETLAKFCPKEMLIEQEHTHRIISGEPMSADEWHREFVQGDAVELDEGNTLQ